MLPGVQRTPPFCCTVQEQATEISDIGRISLCSALGLSGEADQAEAVSYTHLRAHETEADL
eukprot:3111494-Amphidinium_carterae.1